jgi:transcriptional regulator with XRE-family HTH domain
MTFGQALDEELNSRGLSRSDLAREIGLSSTTVHSWIKEGKRPGRDNVLAVERVLDIRPRGRLAGMLGYAGEDGEAGLPPMTLEQHIEADESISKASRVLLLELLAVVRRGEAPESGNRLP